MVFVFGLAGWQAGIALSCLAQALLLGHHLPSWLSMASFGFTYLAPPVGALVAFTVALYTARQYGGLDWRPGLGSAITAAAVAAFTLQSWRFWDVIPRYASIRPLGYDLFVVMASGGIFFLGLLVCAADIAVPQKKRWVGIAAGVAGIGAALLPYWCDHAIMHHFLHVHHFVFED